MESKIEEIMKLGFVKILGEEVADKETILELAEKLSQVIDHLNSQEQGEEKIEIPEAYRKAFLDEDTPEEWEENLGEIIDNIDIKETPSKGDWLDREYKSALKDVVVCFIKQLLEDREREVVEKMYRKQNELLYIGDFERWLKKEYPKLKDIDLDDNC